MNKTLLIATLSAAVLVAACESRAPSTAEREQVQQERTQNSLLTATPLPELSRSVEREQLVRRAERLNTENINGCITLISYGRVIGQFNVDGKPSSLNSYLTGDQRAVRLPVQGSSTGSNETENASGATTGGYRMDALVESPDVDGAYGENVDGIFFFEGGSNAYVEWRGDYFYTDQCLTLNERPLLTRARP